MDGFLQSLGQNIGMVTIGGTIAVACCAMALCQVLAARARERSRRELAAYVAEGSMTADEAERILSAGEAGKPCCGGKRRSSAPPMTADA
ncbi:MAG: hypothetical protein JNK58_08775 [Phycisphaerae bacterium]|nr:hypothetical protein [Phycisphaerae bacterium]